VHLYVADWGWHRLWQGKPFADAPTGDAFPDFASIRNAWQDHERQVYAFIEQLTDAEIPGFWWKLLHLVNHASYHRGQVTTMLRTLGADAPKSQDMVVFSRERDAARSAATI
jgi:uncharacterized damage-inducible protein DinB